MLTRYQLFHYLATAFMHILCVVQQAHSIAATADTLREAEVAYLAAQRQCFNVGASKFDHLLFKKHMRQILIFLTIFGLSISCNQSDTTKVASDTTGVTQQSDTMGITQQRNTAVSKSERQILIEELKRLQSIFESNDKAKIADLFSFPISNATVLIYVDDSTYNTQYEKNGHKVTRAMFIQYYRDISAFLQVDQLKQLFKQINIDNLLQKDTLEHEAIIKAEPCYHFYEVKIEEDMVTLTVGTGSNKDYKSKNVSEDEEPENSSENCEHVLWWVFRFDGKQLHFKEISGAD